MVISPSSVLLAFGLEGINPTQMKYELMVILDPKLTDKDIEKTMSEIKAHATDHGLSIVDEDVWGKRDFAYKLKGHMVGYYVVMTLEGESAGTLEVHSELRLQPGLLRYLLIKVPEDYKMIRFDTERKPDVSRLKSKHAEELSKKVTAKKTPVAVTEEKVEKKKEEPKDTKKLDEQLKAIIEDTDIDL